MSLRVKAQETTRRTVIPDRTSEVPGLRVQADMDSSRGHQAIGSAAADVLGRVGDALARAGAQKRERQFFEDQTQGAKDRTAETLNGNPAQEQAALAQQTDGYRRGYYMTEGANRIQQAKRAIAQEVAQLRPGEDVNPIIQKHTAELLQAPEFQDAQVMREMQPAIQQMRDGILEYRQKTELAEIFDSQSENLRQIARDGIKDGSLLTAKGIENFRAALNTERFAYLDQNDADDILSAAAVDLLESGEGDPSKIVPLLQEGAKASLPAPAGLVEPGNVDLFNRPMVKNSDGSISTVRSISVGIDGAEVLIPTVSPDGRVMSNDEAVAEYQRTGQHLGKFKTAEEATAYAEALHKQQEALYADGAKPAGALWDRAGWSDKFRTAIAAGSAVRERQFEEARAEQLSHMEYQLQGRASKGQLSISAINELADKVGMHGKDRLAFVRRWIDQNDAGLKHMQSEARAAREHRDVIAAINANNTLSLTDSQLNKSAEKEWAAAVTSGNRATQQAVIERYTRAGVVIPQLKDLLSRTTERNLIANATLYEALAKIDRIAADRYLSEENATLFAQHFDNVTLHGMTAEESIQSLPTGATKGRRTEVAGEISAAAVGYFKENPSMPDGADRTPQFRALVEREAVRLALANPNATAVDNLRVAERRMLGTVFSINGRWVPRSGARKDTEGAIGVIAKAVADDLVKKGALTPEIARGVYAAPDPNDRSRFVVLLPNGFPAADPKTGRGVAFDPRRAAQVLRVYDVQRAVAEVRAGHAERMALHGGTRASPGSFVVGGLAPTPMTPPLPPKPKTEDGAPFPSFLEWLGSLTADQQEEIAPSQ